MKEVKTAGVGDTLLRFGDETSCVFEGRGKEREVGYRVERRSNSNGDGRGWHDSIETNCILRKPYEC